MMAVYASKRLQAHKLAKEAKAASLQGEVWLHAEGFAEMLENIKEGNFLVQATIKRASLPKEQQEEQWAGSGWGQWKITAFNESVQEVKAQEVARLVVVTEILAKSTDFLRRIMDMGEGQGITLTCVCPRFHRFPAEDYIWWVTEEHGDSGKKMKKKQCSWWCAACGGQYNWRTPNLKNGSDPSEAKVRREGVTVSSSPSSCRRTLK